MYYIVVPHTPSINMVDKALNCECLRCAVKRCFPEEAQKMYGLVPAECTAGVVQVVRTDSALTSLHSSVRFVTQWKMLMRRERD